VRNSVVRLITVSLPVEGYIVAKMLAANVQAWRSAGISIPSAELMRKIVLKAQDKNFC